MDQMSPSTVKLHGTLWGIAAYFNPAGYRNKLENFRLFRSSLKRQGLPLIVVEAVMGDKAFELQDEDADRVIRVRATAVLWQKERLLNIALSHLPADCDKVVWLDTDVLFGDDHWIVNLSQELENFVVVQPFAQAAQLPRGIRQTLATEQCTGECETVPSSVAWWLQDRPQDGRLSGHTGYAVAARRSLLDRFGFYDHGIAGSGDAIMMGAFFGIDPHVNGYIHLDHCPLLDHAAAWSALVAATVRRSVGFVPGTVFHLWHGSRQSRFYVERGALLTDFDPDHDVAIDSQGCWAWATDKQNLHARVRSYFWMRDEESDETSLVHIRLTSLEEQVVYERSVAEGLQKKLACECAEADRLRAVVASCPGPILRRFCAFIDRCSRLILPRHSRLRRMVRAWFLQPNSR
jgi:hypothetical protein